MKQSFSIKILKYLSQVFFFIFQAGLFVSAFSGCKRLFLMILHGQFNPGQALVFISPLVIVVVMNILIGRFFCGWLCAFGSMHDLIHIISKKIFKMRFTVPAKVDQILKGSKYAFLLLIVVLGWIMDLPFTKTADPWDAFAQVGQGFDVLWETPYAYLFLLFIIIGAFFVERFFCRYLCPLGAIQSIISKISFAKITKPSRDCGKCRLCTAVCPMGIELYKCDTVSGSECIRCLSCIEVCRRKNPKLVLSSVSYALLAFILFGSMYASNQLLNNSKSISENATNTNKVGNAAMAETNDTTTTGTDNTRLDQTNSTSAQNTQQVGNTTQTPAKSSMISPSASPGKSATKPSPGATVMPSPKQTVKPAPTPIPSSANKLYRDGTYTGVGRGYRPNLTVSVTVKNDKITNIQIVSHSETPSYANEPLVVIPQEIIQSQSTQVDAVSGATKTSNGIMSAVADALSKAKI